MKVLSVAKGSGGIRAAEMVELTKESGGVKAQAKGLMRVKVLDVVRGSIVSQDSMEAMMVPKLGGGVG